MRSRSTFSPLAVTRLVPNAGSTVGGNTEAARVVGVVVTTPAGTSVNTSADSYAYGPSTVSSFTPASDITGSTVTITGSGYVPGMTVKFGTLTSPAVTLVSATQIKAVVPNGAVAAAVVVSDGAGSATSSSTFTPTLSITGLSPTSGAVGTSVTISGAGLDSSSAVEFNGTAAATTFVSSTKLTAIVPSGATTGPVTVTNTAAPAGTVRSAANYTVT